MLITHLHLVVVTNENVCACTLRFAFMKNSGTILRLCQSLLEFSCLAKSVAVRNSNLLASPQSLHPPSAVVLIFHIRRPSRITRVETRCYISRRSATAYGGCAQVSAHPAVTDSQYLQPRGHINVQTVALGQYKT